MPSDNGWDALRLGAGLTGLPLALPYGAGVLGQGYAAHVEVVSLFAWGMGYALWRTLPAPQRATGAWLTLALAALSWHLLEAPALARKPTRASARGAHPASVYAA
ncbi:MAG: hypothetical protein Fur007_10540 [Rhodoferax sp.]